MTVVTDAARLASGRAPVEAGVGPGVEERVIEAALACIARHGLSKTTIDDVARQAGCSRATLYRYFSNKRELVERVLAHEIDRVTRDLLGAAAAETTLDDAVTAMYVAAGRELAANEALRFVADFEPEKLLPHLTFAGGDGFLRDASRALAPAFEPYVGRRADRAAEWVVRLGLALWFSPTAPVAMSDEPAMRAYVRELVVPAIRPATEDSVSAQPHSTR